MTSLFAYSSPALWSAWDLAPFRRVVHDPDRRDKITYTARIILVLSGEASLKDAEESSFVPDLMYDSVAGLL